MGELTIHLGVRYAAAFGLLAGSGKPDKAHVNTDYHLAYYDDPDEEIGTIGFSYEGNKVIFGSLPLVPGSEDFSGILAPPPLVRFSRMKSLIETQVNGSDLIVVEQWGMHPWDIRISGLLIDIKERFYPEELIRKLHKLFSYNGVVDVEGSQFDDKDIESVYFKGISIVPVQGFRDTVKFTLTAKSIAPVGFTLNNPK